MQAFLKHESKKLIKPRTETDKSVIVRAFSILLRAMDSTSGQYNQTLYGTPEHHYPQT